jgi:DNA-directed RNA polymerase beta' subunit
MKKTLLEKAQIAVNDLNQIPELIRNQIESGELNHLAVWKATTSAMRKAKQCQKLYFFDADTNQMNEFAAADLDTQIDDSIKRLNDSLTLYQNAIARTL